MDIVEVDGKPLAKRGKLSGAKSVLRCPRCNKNKIVPLNQDSWNCVCGEQYQEILLPFVENGEVITGISKPQEVRDYVLAQIADKTL
jgi:nicotinate phosphoribosyltransferase